MLLRCCLIHKSIIILWHFLYLLYLCPFLDLGLFMLYYVIYFSFSFSFSVWLFVEDHERRRICSSAYFLEYFLFFWTLTWMKNVNNFRVAKVRPQHGVAYKAVPYIKKRVLTGHWSFQPLNAYSFFCDLRPAFLQFWLVSWWFLASPRDKCG